MIVSIFSFVPSVRVKSYVEQLLYNNELVWVGFNAYGGNKWIIYRFVNIHINIDKLVALILTL